MTTACWLGSFADGSVAAKSERHLLKVHHERWLCDKIDSFCSPRPHAEIFWPQAAATNRSGFLIHALVLIKGEGNYNQGVLTPWGQESAIQRLFYELPLDDYECQLEKISPCVEKEFIFSQCSRGSGQVRVVKVNPKCPVFIGSWDKSADTVQVNRECRGESITAEKTTWTLEVR